MVFWAAMDGRVGLEGAGVELGSREIVRLRQGIPEIELRLLRGARDLEPGRAAALLDARGRAVGAGIADPRRGVLRVWSHRPRQAFDAGFFREKVDAALARRRSFLGDPATDCFRLLHGDGDGLPGFAVDRWGEFLTVQVLGAGPARWAAALEEALRDRSGPRGIVRKLIFEGEAAGRGRGKVEESVSWGERPPAALVVRENGVPFQVRLLGARHPGLFTDMREERRRLRGLARGLRVLNTFAFTGGFSVAAALGGAAEVVSVDIVAKVLEWAKENFRLSGIDPARHRFVRMDSLEYLKLARKRGWTFGAIVLDPPTFAASRGGRWSLRRDYPRLIAAAVAVLEPAGYLWVSANTAGITDREVEGWTAAGAGAAGRRLRTVARAGQPADYPAPGPFPRYRYLKVHVLQG